MEGRFCKRVRGGWSESWVQEMPKEDLARMRKERADLGTEVLNIKLGTVILLSCIGTLTDLLEVANLSGVPIRLGNQVYDPQTGEMHTDKDAHLPYI